MTPYGIVNGSAKNDGTVPWRVTAFHMDFADVAGNIDTEKDISGYAGGRPVMPDSTYVFDGAKEPSNIAGALNAFTLSADVPEGLVASPNEIALLPIRARLRVSRKDIDSREWAALESAESVINEFARTYTIWVRSLNALEKGDLNLLQAVTQRGVQAFTHGDFLYIDFIVLAADAKSQEGGDYTAFCNVVEDGGIPYILIGDGEADGKWNLSFYIGQVNLNLNNDSETSGGGGDSGGGGGGCSAGLLPFVFVLPALPLLRGKIRKH
jgi:hypothetical protein